MSTNIYRFTFEFDNGVTICFNKRCDNTEILILCHSYVACFQRGKLKQYFVERLDCDRVVSFHIYCRNK